MEAIAVFFRDGGIFMYIILAVAVIGVAIIIEKRIYLIIKYNVDARALWEKSSKFMQDGDMDKARALCKNSEVPLLKVLSAGISASNGSDKDIQNAIDEASMDLIPSVDKRISYLLTLANSATLFGLLGTIYGLIQSFSAVASADPSQKATLLAGGISIALYNTSFGIGVAVFFLIMYAILQARATRIIDEIDSFSVKVINLLSKLSRGKGGIQAQ